MDVNQYNLTPKVGEFLDVHLLLKILNFYEQNELYPQSELLQAKIDLLSKTNMVTYAVEMYQKLHNTEEEPEEMTKQKDVLIETLTNLKSRRFLELFDEEKKDELNQLVESGHWNLAHLEATYKVSKLDISSIYSLAKFYFECGQYTYAADLLRHFRALNSDPKKNKAALWGKLAAEIVMCNWSEVKTDLEELEKIISSQDAQTPLQQLQERCWLSHWALFGMFQTQQNPVVMLDMFLGNEAYSRVIQTKAPWILRYLAVAAILTKHRLRETVELIDQEISIYSDPITNFIYQLYVKFDFSAAEKELSLCGDIISRDYFFSVPTELEEEEGEDEDEGEMGKKKLRKIGEKFLEAGKLAVCEAFCKIHSTIDIEMMAKKLGKSNEDSERWIVNLIRNSKLDAKIDSAKNQVIVSSQVPNAYQQLLEKTKSLSLRAGLLANNLERMKTQQQQPVNVHGRGETSNTKA